MGVNNIFRTAISRTKSALKIQSSQQKKQIRNQLKSDIKGMTDYFERATSADPRQRRQTIENDIHNTSGQ